MSDLTKDKLLWIYERMRLIREFEERASKEFAAGNIPGFVHLYAGEEAVGVGVCANLTDQDYITSTHRGHGHCIAKGVDVKEMMAELKGKATGACKGKGGSMHIADMSKGMLGANGIVGAGGPLACGAGLTAKYKKTGQVAVCFFGDGGSEQGTMHESMNLASIWKLPVIFVCENNGYAEATPAKYHCSVKDIADRAKGYGMPGFTADGADVFDVYEAVGKAVERARRGQGPTLIECKTFRLFGHEEGDAATYRTPEQEEANRQREPIGNFKRRILERGIVSEAELKEIDERVKKSVEDAVKFADESPYPALEECYTDVYVSYR